MTTPPAPTLAARWIAALQSDVAYDQNVVVIIERAMEGETVSEAALLRSMLSHADELAAGAQAPESGATR
jgi:hypothetical protein